MNQLKTGAILNYVIILLNTTVGLLYTPYMLEKMGQSEYGLYSLVASVISYLTILDLGFGNAIIRYTAKFRAENNIQGQYEMFGMFFILYLIIGIIAFILGLGLYFNIETFFDSTMSITEIERAKIMMLMLVFNLSITFPMSIFGSIINAYENFVFQKTINIIRVILNTVVMIVLLHYGYKAIALVAVQTILNITTLIINYIYCKHKLHIKLLFGKFNYSFLKEVSIYSLWIFMNIIMDRVYWSTGQFVLGAVAGTVSIAIFAVAIQLQHLFMQFSTAISGVFLPRVTSMVTKRDNTEEVSELFIKTGRIQYIMMSLLFSGFIIFGKPFIILWAGSEYTDVYYICILFFSALMIPLIQNLGITILQARNQMKFRSILYFAISILALIMQIILAKQYGGIGCAIAISGALIIGQGFIMNIYYQKKQRLNIIKFWREILKMSVIPIILSVITSRILQNIELCSWKNLILHIIAYTLVYIPLFYLFSMNKYEKGLIKTPITKLYRKVIR